MPDRRPFAGHPVAGRQRGRPLVLPAESDDHGGETAFALGDPQLGGGGRFGHRRGLSRGAASVADGSGAVEKNPGRVLAAARRPA